MDGSDGREPVTLTRHDVVNLLYGALLKRQAETTGLKAQLAKRPDYGTDADWISGLIDRLVASDEFSALTRQRLFEKNLFVERSQGGEVEVILRSLILDDVRRLKVQPVLVDVGASGKAISNSFDILKHFPIRGVLIEANPEQCEAIKRDFAGLDISLVNAAVSTKEEEVTLWVSRSNTHIASLMPTRFDQWKERENFQDLKKDVEFKLQARRLVDILREQKVEPNFLMMSIDIEGLDCPVLNDMFGTSSYRPYYLIIEGSKGHVEREVPEVAKSYDLIAATKSNVVLRRRG